MSDRDKRVETVAWKTVKRGFIGTRVNGFELE